MRIPRRQLEKARIEIIPMIDIIFFLLVFFMVSTLSMTINRGLPVNLPTAASFQKDLRERFNVTVMQDGVKPTEYATLQPRRPRSVSVPTARQRQPGSQHTAVANCRGSGVSRA